jgi:hypothetical protein
MSMGLSARTAQDVDGFERAFMWDDLCTGCAARRPAELWRLTLRRSRRPSSVQGSMSPVIEAQQ